MEPRKTLVCRCDAISHWPVAPQAGSLRYHKIRIARPVAETGPFFCSGSAYIFKNQKAVTASAKPAVPRRVDRNKRTAVCSHCGNEAEMVVDYSGS